MNKDQYNKNLKDIQLDFEKKKKELREKYAAANNPYKVGDIVTDHIGTIMIEAIQTYVGFDEYPQCVYTGPELKKDLTPKKNNAKRSAYQSNLVN